MLAGYKQVLTKPNMHTVVWCLYRVPTDLESQEKLENYAGDQGNFLHLIHDFQKLHFDCYISQPKYNCCLFGNVISRTEHN